MGEIVGEILYIVLSSASKLVHNRAVYIVCYTANNSPVHCDEASW